MTRKQITLSSTLFVLAFLIGAVINIPAVQIMNFITLPKQVAVQGIQGSVTNGVVDRLDIQGYTISNVKFHFQPTCLLKISVCYQLSSDEDGVLLNLDYSLLTQSSDISDSYIDLPSSVLDNVPNMLVKPAGDFRIEIEQLQVNSERKLTDLKALMHWNNAGIEGEDQVIGNYAADISSSKNGLSANLSDKNSLLGLKGDILLNWNGSYEADLQFEHKTGLNPSLLSVLDMSAKKSGLNQYRLKKKGVLPASISNQIKMLSP
jgi:general secretion pathway protein N